VSLNTGGGINPGRKKVGEQPEREKAERAFRVSKNGAARRQIWGNKAKNKRGGGKVPGRGFTEGSGADPSHVVHLFKNARCNFKSLTQHARTGNRPRRGGRGR